MKPLKLGNLELRSPVILAPMVDVTDSAFRQLCKRAGAGIVYTEMLQVEAILHENKKTKNKMYFTDSERPIGIQITSRTVESIKKVSPLLKDYDLVDLNCGCPSHLTVDHQSGSYLMKNPKKIGDMIRVLKKDHKVVTAKIRLGFKKNNVLEVAKEVEKAGADAITVHGRLAKNGRGIPSDWNEIKKVKNYVNIPVIGNGDVRDEESAEKMLEIVDGAMIARATIGDPLIFERVNHYLETGKKKEFDFKRNMELYLEYLELAEKHKIKSLQRAKYVGGKFIQRVEGAPEMRNEFMKIKSLEGIKSFIENILKND